MPVAFGVVCLLMSGRRRRNWLVGWTFGTAHFAAGLFWVGEAFLVDSQRWGWLALPSVLFLALATGAFPAVALTLAARWGFSNVRGLIHLATFWVGCEWLRSTMFSGFPWNLLGDVWLFRVETAQLAAWTGVWGLSFLAILFAGSPLLLCADKSNARIAGCVFAIIPLLLLCLGTLRLHAKENVFHAEPLLRIVQPAIPQRRKWEPSQRERNIREQIVLSRSENNPTYVFWSEAALPILLSSQSTLPARLAPYVVRPGSFWVFGAVWRSRDRGEAIYTNRLLVSDSQGNIVQHYDKKHLTPFGEYTPWPDFLARPLAWGTGFTSGVGPRETLSIPGLPAFSPLICYEIVFPAAVRTQHAQWILNLTNDAWFGNTPGPHQHLASARMRAIEEGVPILRVAGSGISALIDPWGRILARIDLFVQDSLDVRLPVPAETTLFSLFGNRVLLFLASFFVVFESASRFRKRGTTTPDRRRKTITRHEP